MKVLFAPWRYKYVTRSSDTQKGMFHDLIADNRDKEGLIVFRGETCVIMLNRYPYSSGHVMILPNRQVENLEDLFDQERDELMRLAQTAVRALKQVYDPHGFNIGLNLGSAAGAGVAEHLHMHVVPRWSGDTNFMTSTANTRVVPEDLEQAYSKIKAALQTVQKNDKEL